MNLDPGEERTDDVNFSIIPGYQPGPTHDSRSVENLTMEIIVRKPEKPQSGGFDRLRGPKPTNLTLQNETVIQGNSVKIINASFDNQGTTQQSRGGTPVVAGEYYVVKGDVEDPENGNLVSPDDPQKETPLESGDGLPLDSILNPALAVTTTGEISTDTLAPGKYTVFIRGQDTRGIWTNESRDTPVENESFRTFEVQQPVRNLTLDARNQVIDPGDSNTVNVALSDEFDNPLNETVTVEIINGDGQLDTGNGSGGTVSVRTGNDGKATLEYGSVSADGGETITIRGEADEDPNKNDTVSFAVTTGEPNVIVEDFEADDLFTVEEAEQNITLTESEGVQTENIVLTLQVFDLGGNTVYSESVDATDIGELNGNSVTVQFGGQYGTERLGQFESGTYTANATVRGTNFETDSNTSTFSVADTKINFETDSTDTPDGYLRDIGDALGERSSGLAYGWVGGDNTEMRERGLVADTRNDTLAHMDFEDTSGGLNWAIELPDGTYYVEFLMGDPDYTDSNHTVQIEDQVFVDEDGTGGSNFVRHVGGVQVTDGELTISPVNTGDSGIPGESQLGNQKATWIHITPAEPAVFDVTITGTNSPITEGEDVTVDYEVTNTGGVPDTQDIVLDINGTTEATQSLALDSGQTSTGTFTYTTGTGDAPAVEAAVSSNDDSATETVSVNEPAFFEVNITGTNSPVTEGEDVTVDYEVTNTGDVSGTQDIAFDINGTNQATESSVTLSSGQTSTGTFTYTTGTGDAPAVEAAVSSNDDSATETVSVDPSQFYPTRSISNQGTLNNFANMQSDDGTVAAMLGEGGGGSAFDIDVITEQVPPGGYTLEVQIDAGSFQGGGVDVTVTDENGEIGSGTISTTGLFTIDLDPSVEGDITVRYEGRNQNTDLDVDFQRLVS
jgi:hypothetical protein